MSEEAKTSETPEVAQTPEPVLSIDERVSGYNAENKLILAKYNLVLTAEPFISQGKTLARPLLITVERYNEIKESLESDAVLP